MEISRVVLPTDLSESADRALKQAVEIAVQHRAKLEVLHVVTLESLDSADLQKELETYMTRVEKEVFEDLATRSEGIKTRGVAVETVVLRRTYPIEAILDRIREIPPDVVVMGTHGRRGLTRLLLGSVASRVVQEASCPVMTVAADAEVAEGERGFESILVPVDFSEVTEKAMEWAKALVAPDGRLILEHVVSSPIHPSLYAGGVTKIFPLHPELPSLIGKRLSELYSGPSDVVVTEGSVVDEILDTAKSKKAQLIVMGTRGLQGSVTGKVLGRAKVPVLAVK
jgi:nucleotide-binding universal stress UspA family protein